MKKIFLFGLILFVMSCTKKNSVDLIFYNAKVFTVNSNFEIKEAFAVKNGKFVAIGSNSEILNNYTATEIIDLKGKYVYPGLIDAHCHFIGYSESFSLANLKGCQSIAEVVKIMVEHNKKYDPQWLCGKGWDQNNWVNKAFPDKELLDSAFPDKPVVLTRIDGHAVLVNSKALELAGFNSETKIAGGELHQKNGELTGILLENAADSIKNMIPKMQNKELSTAMLNAQKNCFTVGLTSVVDAGLPINRIELIDELQKENKLKIRIYAMLEGSDNRWKEFAKRGHQKTERLFVRSVKFYADGALGSRGAKLIEPYNDSPENSGILVKQPMELKELFQYAYDNGFQVNTHAIGDSAVRLLLKLYSEILPKNNDLRWRIEHAQVVNKNDFEKFAEFSIIPSIQPTHATSDMYWATERLGNERIKYAYAYRKLLEQNNWIPAGSDFPIEDINPLLGFYAAVARQDVKGFPKEGFQTENALTREQALRATTIWAAKASFEENEKGSIEPNKYADFIILDKDLMTIDLIKIPDIKIVATFINGEKVF